MSDVETPEANEWLAEPAAGGEPTPVHPVQQMPRKSVASVRSHGTKEVAHAREGGGGKRVPRLIGVRISSSGMVYRFVSTLKEIKEGDAVLLQGPEEESMGWVVFVTGGKPDESLLSRVYTGGYEKIVRVMSEHERAYYDSSQGQSGRDVLEAEARKLCREKMRELGLPMRLSKVRYLAGGSKLLISFTAESRVDFRDLVRILGSQLRVRVEMRHIGVRDETRLLGGIGLCGQEFCCSSYLKRFHPVSVRMAKNQELSLNPEGISGTCGRLLCCLEYENATYQSLREGMPRLKQSVQAADGREGVVQAVHPLSGTVDVQLTDGTRACFGRCDYCAGEGTALPPAETEREMEEEEEASVAGTPPPRVAVAKESGGGGVPRPAARRRGGTEGRTRPPASSPGKESPGAVAAVQEAVAVDTSSALEGAEGGAVSRTRKRRRRRRPAAAEGKGVAP